MSGSGVSGDVARLKHLTASLRRLTGVDKEVAKMAVGPLNGQTGSTFHASSNPYGDPWPPLKRGGRRVLVQTGAILAAVTGMAQSGTRMRATLPYYARYQNPRLFVPGRTPPPSWLAIVDPLALVAVDAIIARGR